MFSVYYLDSYTIRRIDVIPSPYTTGRVCIPGRKGRMVELPPSVIFTDEFKANQALRLQLEAAESRLRERIDHITDELLAVVKAKAQVIAVLEE